MDANSIKETSVRNEYSVLSTSQYNVFYTVNSEFGACTCPAGISKVPCKHQSMVLMKCYTAILNFIPSLTPRDCMVYFYVALDK